jgi:hypothetical protein
MSPGVLLSTGYIAGGAIGGILIALVSVSGGVSKFLATWQYPRYTLTQELSVEDAYRTMAADELGLDQAIAADSQTERIRSLVEEIKKLNEDQLPRYARVAAGTVLKLPHNQAYEVATATTLGEAAQQALGSADKASLLFDLNADQIKLPEILPVGATLKLPQRTLSAVAAFASLAVLLTLVGAGWLMQSTDSVAQGPRRLS